MVDRETALGNIAVGDVFHASAPNGASLICLTREATETILYARTVTSQFDLEFDRLSGVANWEFEGHRVTCVIDSVAALPADVYQIMLGLDRKFSPQAQNEDSRLTEDQKRALLFVARFYPANPIAMPWQAMSIGRAVPKEDSELSAREKSDQILSTFLIPANRP